MLSGELMGVNALSGEIQKQVIAVGGGDAPIKTISVDGVNIEPDKEKNVNIDLSGKVDKVTEPTNTPQVYAKNKDGSQGMLNAVQYYSEDRNGLVRYINGNIVVNTPTEGGHATTKNYVDNNFVKQQELSETEALPYYAYVRTKKTVDGETKEVDDKVGITQWGASPYTIAQRTNSGALIVGTPTNNNEATPKKYVDDKFNGANKAVSFVNYSAMISSLNTLPNNSYSVGQNIMIVTLQVPDLWVSEIAETSVAYSYVSDDDFVADLNTNGSVQVGYYKLSALETQKVDLAEYAKLTQLDGKVDKQTPEFDAGATRGYVYFIDTDHNQTVKKVQIQANADTIPLRNPSGTFYVGNATLPYEAVNKGYVDSLVSNMSKATVIRLPREV